LRQRENLRRDLESKLALEANTQEQPLTPLVTQLVEKYGANQLALAALQMVLDSFPVVEVPPLPPPETQQRPQFASKPPQQGRFRDGPGFGPRGGKPKPWGASSGSKKPYESKGGSRFGGSSKGSRSGGPNRESNAGR